MPRRLLLLLLVCAAVSLFAVLYPIYVIRPFRAQGPRELAVALAVMRWRGAVTVIAALTAIVAYWRVQPRRWPQAVAVAAIALLAVLARVNVYELMFHPAGAPAFSPAADVRLDGDEK